MSSAARRSRWARRTVAVGVLSLVGWQTLVLLRGPTTAALLLGVCGFVGHVLFGKAYALVPSYFDRTLRPSWAPAAQLPLTTVGVLLLAVGYAFGGDQVVEVTGAALWTAGAVVFVASIAWSLRDNLTGAETGTGEHNAHRRRLDRVANPFILVAVGYLLVGSVDLLAVVSEGFPSPLVASSLAGAVHLLAAGGAVGALVAVGYRLLPRFLVSTPPFALPAVVLPTAALGPVLIVASFGSGPVFVAGALAEAVAVLGFATTVLLLVSRSDRDRVGFLGVLGGAVAGAVGVTVGLSFALLGVDPGLIAVHRRLNLVGLLGLSVVGVAFQFYPPSVGRHWLATDRTAVVALAAVAGGLLIETGGRLLEVGGLLGAGAVAVVVGRFLVWVGVVVAAALFAGAFRSA